MMPSWAEIMHECQAAAGQGLHPDVVRRRYVEQLHNLTGRNVLVYYSGWLHADPRERGGSIEDADMTGFMTALHGMDCGLGLDLVLHTPGGDAFATEHIVRYLHSKFKDIRVLVPHTAFSGGTVIALGANSIVMGNHSCLGPIDPQLAGMPAQAIVQEFEEAVNAIQNNHPSAMLRQEMILSRYSPTILTQCMNVIHMINEFAMEILEQRMFRHRRPLRRKELARKVVEEIGSNNITRAHGRHINRDWAQRLGLTVVSLEDDQNLQEAVLSLHHALTVMSQIFGAIKIIESQMEDSTYSIASTPPQSAQMPTPPQYP